MLNIKDYTIELCGKDTDFSVLQQEELLFSEEQQVDSSPSFV